MAGKTFRVFVSSTFSDLKAERDALQHCVFPRLRELAARHGCRFQAIDLRWGVREEAGLDQRTVEICLTEIARCQRVSPRPNFIVLLGERYGWRPLPYQIAASGYEAITAKLSANERDRLGRWYIRDDNAVPPVYDLQPRTDAFLDRKRWKEEERDLLAILERAVAGLTLPQRSECKYGNSATEQEILKGIAAPDAREHVFCFLRTLRGLPQDAQASDYLDLLPNGRVDQDARARLASLKARLHQELPDNLVSAEVAWNQGRLSDDYLRRFCRAVYRRLAKVIKAEAVRTVAADPLDEEVAAHARFGAERSHIFHGRSGPLEAIRSYVAGSDAAPFAVIGKPGSGKSALLAKAAAELRQASPGVLIIQRFIGATPLSSNVRDLLESLCREISRACGADAGDLSLNIDDLARELPRRLALATAARPLVIFLDALDQLSVAHNVHGLFWLPVELPEHAHLVCSATPGDCAKALAGKLPAATRLQIEPMGRSEGEQVLSQWLGEAGRTLQADQRDEILGQFQHNGLPFWLKLAFEEARLWKSYQPAGQCKLSPEVPALIGQLFDRLTAPANHGEVLVAHALGYLGAARNGLAEDELLEVLAADPEVMADVVGKARHQIPETGGTIQLPAVVWSRLHFDLKPYLTERAGDGMSLLATYHRQIAAVVADRFMDPAAKRLRHRLLAKHFCRQPLELNGGTGRFFNLRKLSELPWHLFGAGHLARLESLLADPTFLEAKARAEGLGVDALMADYELVPERQTLDPLRDAVWSDAGFLRRYPELILQQMQWHISTAPTASVRLRKTLYRATVTRRRSGLPFVRPLFPPIRSGGGHGLSQLVAKHVAWFATLGDDVLVIQSPGRYLLLDRDGSEHEAGVFSQWPLGLLRSRGRALLCASGDMASVWRQWPGSTVTRFLTCSPIVTGDIAANGKIVLVAGDDGGWALVRIEPPQAQRIAGGQLGGRPTAAALAADGVVGALGTLKGDLWAVSAAGSQRLESQNAPIRRVLIAPGSQAVLALTYDGRLVTQDIGAREQARPVHGAAFVDIAVSPGTATLFAATSEGECVTVDWSTLTLGAKETCPDHDPPAAVDQLPDGTRVILQSDRSLFLARKPRSRAAIAATHRAAVTLAGIVRIEDDTYVGISQDGQMRLHSTAHLVPRREIGTVGHPVQVVHALGGGHAILSALGGLDPFCARFIWRKDVEQAEIKQLPPPFSGVFDSMLGMNPTLSSRSPNGRFLAFAARTRSAATLHTHVAVVATFDWRVVHRRRLDGGYWLIFVGDDGSLLTAEDGSSSLPTITTITGNCNVHLPTVGLKWGALSSADGVAVIADFEGRLWLLHAPWNVPPTEMGFIADRSLALAPDGKSVGVVRPENLIEVQQCAPAGTDQPAFIRRFPALGKTCELAFEVDRPRLNMIGEDSFQVLQL